MEQSWSRAEQDARQAVAGLLLLLLASERDTVGGSSHVRRTVLAPSKATRSTSERCLNSGVRQQNVRMSAVCMYVCISVSMRTRLDGRGGIRRGLHGGAQTVATERGPADSN